MSEVICLSHWRNRDSANLVQDLSSKLERGELAGLLVHEIDSKGRERTFSTGLFTRDPRRAMAAGLQILLLTCAQRGRSHGGTS